MKVHWFDDEIASLICECGQEVMASLYGTTCEKCGRRYTVVEMVHIDQPLGRCAGPDCGKWLYGTQRKRKRYCSEDCGVKARKAKKEDR